MPLVLQSSSELFNLDSDLTNEELQRLNQDLAPEFGYIYYYDDFNDIRLRVPSKGCRVLTQLFSVTDSATLDASECFELKILLDGVEVVNANKYLDIFKEYLDRATTDNLKLHVLKERG